jgi:hypothetical protein
LITICVTWATRFVVYDTQTAIMVAKCGPEKVAGMPETADDPAADDRLAEAELTELDFTDAVFADQEWDGRCYIGCRFTEADMRGLHTRSCRFTNCDFPTPTWAPRSTVRRRFTVAPSSAPR